MGSMRPRPCRLVFDTAQGGDTPDIADVARRDQYQKLMELLNAEIIEVQTRS